MHRPCSGQRPVIVNVDCPIVDFQLLELLKCYKRKTVAGVNYTKSINRPIGKLELLGYNGRLTIRKLDIVDNNYISIAMGCNCSHNFITAYILL